MAREHAYRPALQQLLSELLPQYTTTNEPARISCGAPDFIISQKTGAKQVVFFIEAKDLFDNDLDGMRQHKEQFSRYKKSLDHIIFTDYLDFHFYENGQWVKNVRIAEQQGTHIRLVKDAETEFKNMLGIFSSAKPIPITSATRLAELMAAKARLLADTIIKAFEESEKNGSNNSQLQSELDGFRKILIHDLSVEGFADIYAQTIVYGMFAARLHDDTPEDFCRQKAANLIPKTNPFLRKIFQQIAGYDLDERLAWIVDDLSNTFLATNVEKVMKPYTGNKLHNDPMIHFYEDFLSAYNPQLRKSKGVWYTPQPVVRFIVRAVDEILQRDFGLPMGLADSSMIEHEVVNDQWDGKKKTPRTYKRKEHRVQILDPATGTGTFLAEIVSQIYQKFDRMQGVWQGYVEEHLIPRLHGFELLMASYAVAHLKLDMQLRSMGYDSSKSKSSRLKVYLTNSLEECHPDTGSLFAQWLSCEANEANYIKRDCPVMVMVGNPPYSGESQNKGEWIMRLMESYKKEPGGKEPLKERNPKWINDDYVKFIRLAQNYIERNGQGVIGFINPHGYLDNPTFRGMRWSLLHSFDKIYTIDLHGNTKKKENCPDGSKDENVFDIMQGVSINIFVKTGKKTNNELGKVYHKDLYGLREDKYEFLNTNTLNSVGYEELNPQEPMYFFVSKDMKLGNEYQSHISINSIFIRCLLGPNSHRDDFAISFTEKEANLKLAKFSDTSYSDIEILQYFKLKNGRDWNISDARNSLNGKEKPLKCLYRPFDYRYMLYGAYAFDYHRPLLNDPMLKDNIVIVITKQTKENFAAFASDIPLGQHKIATPYDGSYGCPLYLYTTNIDGTEDKVPNLNKEEWAKFDKAVGRETTPEELLHYIYGVLHSPSYRERYKEFLKIDFPRIPLPQNEEEFMRKADKGRQLIDLHLMHNTSAWQPITTFPESGDCMVETISYKDGRVMINATQYFGNVPEEAWNAYIGGYQPAQKWLKDRKGRTLAFDDIRHYMNIIHALIETQRLMSEIG